MIHIIAGPDIGPYVLVFNEVSSANDMERISHVIALDNGVPVTSPSYFQNMDLKKARELFQGDPAEEGSHATTVPLLEERVRVMREAGKILVDQFQGSFASCLEESNGSSKQLLSLLDKHFPCFRDVHQYRGETGIQFDVDT